MSITVLRAGLLATVQDSGRFGFRRHGVTVGGALDSHALRVVNLLVGNAPSAAGLEFALGPARLRLDDDRALAWSGGEFDVRIAGRPLPAGRAALIARGEEVLLSPSKNGGRAWLAFSGGVDVPEVLGSRGTELRGGFGGCHGRALRDGDVLKLGVPCAQLPMKSRVADWSAPSEWVRTRTSHGFLRIIPGAEADQFAADALRGVSFAVMPESDRMGLRLQGKPVARNTNDDLISEAVAPGTIQVPPDGQPIILLGDCQTIGGYPKIAHVITVDLPAAAQLHAGDRIRFAEVTLAEAQQLLRQRERDVAWFRAGLELRTRWS